MRKVALLVIMVTVLSLMALGCAQRQVVSDTEAEPAPQQVTAGATEGDIAIESEDVETTDITRMAQELEEAGLSDIYFDFDSYEIREDAKQTLMTLADRILGSEASVLVEGHCDDRGTNEYNLALGDRRARATKDFLKAAGVPNNRIETISFGEEKPTCDEQNESCWSQNRRAHFIVEGGR